MFNTYTETDALYSLAANLPNYQFVEGDGVLIVIDRDIDDGIVDGTYTSNTVSPFTQAEITTEVTRLQGIYDSQEYARLRAAEYSMLNQFEMQYDDQQNNTTTWADAINAIKVRFPK